MSILEWAPLYSSDAVFLDYSILFAREVTLVIMDTLIFLTYLLTYLRTGKRHVRPSALPIPITS